MYKKIHSLSLNSIEYFNKGKIVNIAATELEALECAFGMHPSVILMPFYLFTCTYML